MLAKLSYTYMNRDVYVLRSRSKPSILLFESRTICTHSESLVYMERDLRRIIECIPEKVKNLI